MKKIADIRTGIIEEQANSDRQVEYLPLCPYTISSFQLAKEPLIMKLIKDSPTKSCQLDPIPT